MRIGGTKEFRATTLLDMGDSPSLGMWLPEGLKKEIHPDAGFAVHMPRENWYLIPF
jgi:hypothetical protein